MTGYFEPPHDGAPDVAGVVTGWRRWTFEVDEDGRPRLSSPLRRTRWVPRVAAVARCGVGHPAPTSSCSCGLYAVTDALTAISATVRGTGGQVLGCVALWGDLVEGDRGVRGSHGYPQLLIVDPEVDPADVARLGDEYGVPVHRSPVPLEALPPEPEAHSDDAWGWGQRRRVRESHAVRDAAERVRRELADPRPTNGGVAGRLQVDALLAAMDRGVRRCRNPMRETVAATLGVLLRLSVLPVLYCGLVGLAVSWQQTSGSWSGLVLLALLPLGLRVFYEILVGLVRWIAVAAARWPGAGVWLSAGTVLPLGAASVLGAIAVGTSALDGRVTALWLLVPVPATLITFLVALCWIGRRNQIDSTTTTARSAPTLAPERG